MEQMTQHEKQHVRTTTLKSREDLEFLSSRTTQKNLKKISGNFAKSATLKQHTNHKKEGESMNNKKQTRIKVIYLKDGKKESVLLEGTAEQIEFWNRQRNGEVSVIEARRVK